MIDESVLEMYERNQELIEEMWEDLMDDETEVKTLVFNHDPFPFPM